MVASANIKTPSMEVPFLPNVSDKAKDALRISLNKVTLANVLEAVHVTEKIEMSSGCRKRLIKMRFEFLPKKQYKNQVCTILQIRPFLSRSKWNMGEILAFLA